MKKRLIALFCMVALLVGVFAIGAAATATDGDGTYNVGYAKVDVSPWVKDYPSAEEANNMTDDNGNVIGFTYDPAWETDYADDFTKMSVVVDTEGTKTPVDVGYFCAPIGYMGHVFNTVVDTNGDNLLGRGDGIYATVTSVTDSEGETLIFVTIEGIGGYVALLEALKVSAVEAIAAEGGNLSADRIYVNGSHSHCAIDLIRLAARKDEPSVAYWEYYKQRVADAVVAAYKSASPATMSKGQLDVSDTIGHQMNFIRHYNNKIEHKFFGYTYDTEWTIRGSNFGGSEGTRDSHLYDADDTLYLLQFTPTNGDAPIVMMNWRAHGTMVNGQNILSGDHIAGIRSTMEKAGYRFAYLQGAAGNTVPESAISTLNTWKTATADDFTYVSDDTNATNVHRYGYWMTKAAIACLNNMTQVEAGKIRTLYYDFVTDKQKDSAVEIEAIFYWHDVMGSPNKGGITYVENGVEKTFDGFPWIYTSASGEMAIFDSYYHLHNGYDRNSTAAAQAATKNSAIRLNAMLLGDEVAFVTCGNEISDRYSLTDSLVYNKSTGYTLKENDNDWLDLIDETYGMPFVLGYTSGNHPYMSNSLSYTYNAGSTKVAGGCYESKTSPFAQGTGEKMIVEFNNMLDSLAASGNTKNATCPNCGNSAEWVGLNTYTYSNYKAELNGHYYLLEDLSINDSISLKAGAKVCLDLNGHSLTSAERAFSVPSKSTLNLIDSVGTGVANATMHGNNPVSGMCQISGTMNIYGGSYRLLRGTVEKGTAAAGLFSIQAGANLNIYGGTLYGADLTDNKYGYTAKDGYGSAIYLYSNSNLFVGGDAHIVSGTVPAHGAGTCVAVHDRTGKITLQGNANVDEIYYIGVGGTSLTVSGDYTGTVALQLDPAITLEDMDIGTSKNANLTGANISCVNDPLYKLFVSETNLILRRDPVAYVGDTAYFAFQDAVNAAQAGSVVRLAKDIAETVAVSKDVTIDLNGFDIAKIVADNCTVSCYDSQTDDHDVYDGVYGTVNGDAVAADGYIAVTETDGVSFHKVSLNITAMSLRASVAGVYYKSNFKTNDVAAKHIKQYGVALSVKGEPNETNMGTTAAYSRFTNFASGNATGTLLKNIMKPGSTDANNNRNANMAIYGRPYILTTDGQYIFGETVQRSLKQQLEAIDANWANYSEATKATVVNMYKKYLRVMKNWNIPNIDKEADPAQDDTLKILMVGNSFCYYYVEELYGLLMANTDTDRGYKDVEIYNLYYSGCKLEQHYNWWIAGEAKYELYKTDKNGRVRQTSVDGNVWKLEDALVLDNWDYLSLQGASTETDYVKDSTENICATFAQYAEPLLGHFYDLHPMAQLLWHRTWPFEEGRISGNRVYDAESLAAYEIGIQAACDWMCNEFDQDKPYDLKIVNSGAAWPIAREENAKLATSLIPEGGLCARLGVRNETTFPYFQGNPNAGDGYHDGDIGGGQFLNACVWYETITGQSCLENTYKPTKDNGKYELSDDFADLLRRAAHAATIHQ